MSEKPIDLDDRRGMASQHATDLRRLTAEVEADSAKLQQRQRDLERHFATMPAQSWPEAAHKARYLLSMLARTTGDARIRMLIDTVIADFDRLSGEGP
jgi:hypothetical protein